MSCFCHSGKPYAECCQPFHKGKRPQNALQLMRSRYSAYARWLPSYIIATTHPDNPSYCENPAVWAKEILQFCRSTQFAGLEILEFMDGDEEAFVTFVADLKEASFKEKSRFVKVEDRWLYHSAYSAAQQAAE